MSQFFASGGQSIGASASASVLPMNIQDWLPLGWTGWITLQSKGLSRVFKKHQFFSTQLSFSHPYMTTGQTIALTRQTFVGKVMPLLFNMLSRLVIAFRRNNGNSDRLFSWAPKSLQMVTAAMKIKDTCSLKKCYDLLICLASERREKAGAKQEMLGERNHWDCLPVTISKWDFVPLPGSYFGIWWLDSITANKGMYETLILF